MFDDYRENLAANDVYKKFVNFYLEKDELNYYMTTSPENQWLNLVHQSEGLWPAFIEEINKYRDESRPVIFECVNLLPHLIKKTFDIPAVVLIGRSYEETLQRNKKDPRWGTTEQLQELEATSFFYAERPMYMSEGKKYGYPLFESAEEAFNKSLRFLE